MAMGIWLLLRLINRPRGLLKKFWARKSDSIAFIAVSLTDGGRYGNKMQ